MTLTTSGSRLTAARPRTRPATTSRPARPGENRPAAGGAPAPRALGFEPGQTVERQPYDLAVRRAQGSRWHPARPPAWQRPQSRRPVRRAAGGRAACHRRAQTRAPHRGRQEGPAEPAVLRPDDLAVQVDLDLPRLPRRERPPGPPSRRQRRRRVLVRPGRRGRRDDLAGRERRVRLLPARGRLHPHRLPQHPRPRPRNRPVARSRPGRRALAAAHLPGRRHAAARPLPDRPHRHAPAPTGNGGPRTPWATTSTSARSPRSSPSTSKKPSPPGSAWNGPPATTATASRSRASPAR